jgi:hypothetical protein
MKQSKLVKGHELMDANGGKRVVNEFVEMVPAGTLRDPDAVEEGLRFLETDAGEHVNANRDGTFTIISTGETLVRL